MQRELFTAGYAGHDLDSLLHMLTEHRIEMVVDIRRNPVSRKKGFSRLRLAEARFRDYLACEAHTLRDLGAMASRKRCCLLCVEEKPEECHRSVVAEEAVSRGAQEMTITHLTKQL